MAELISWSEQKSELAVKETAVSTDTRKSQNKSGNAKKGFGSKI